MTLEAEVRCCCRITHDLADLARVGRQQRVRTLAAHEQPQRGQLDGAGKELAAHGSNDPHQPRARQERQRAHERLALLVCRRLEGEKFFQLIDDQKHARGPATGGQGRPGERRLQRRREQHEPFGIGHAIGQTGRV